ncbi:MAG TPA: AtpZ/AtpI family protein [Acidimicrobiales bacterium]|nr:AtpZ/AtpI family protein [Acidimicrobiales bacterium]
MSSNHVPPPPPRYPGAAAYAGLGVACALCLLGGGALGWLADQAAGTIPLFLLVGLCLGAALAVLVVRSEFRKYSR